MVKVFVFYEVEKFEESGYTSSLQEDIFASALEGANISLKDVENGTLPSSTYGKTLSIEPTEDTGLGEFNIYSCHYDAEKKINGKVFGIDFSSYLEPSDFNLYYNQHKKLCIIQASTQTAGDFVKELNKTTSFNLSPVNIDFKFIETRADDITGAWVAELKNANLKSAGLFGPNVHRSTEYRDAISEGQTSLFIIKFDNPNDDIEHTIGISKKGSVILYSKLNNTNLELEFAYYIYKYFILK